MKYDKVQNTLNWFNVLISTGEEPIIKQNSGGGAVNRVIEIECDKKLVSGGNKVVEVIKSNYGHAGKKFIEIVKKENIKRIYKSYYDVILDISKSTEKQIMAMSLILTADHLTSKYIFEDDVINIKEACEFLKEKAQINQSERAFELIKSIITTNISKFQHDSNGNLPFQIWGKVITNETGTIIEYVYILKNVLIEQLEKNNISFEAVKKDWINKGYLIKVNDKQITHKTTAFGLKGRYLKINLKNPTFKNCE